MMKGYKHIFTNFMLIKIHRDNQTINAVMTALIVVTLWFFTKNFDFLGILCSVFLLLSSLYYQEKITKITPIILLLVFFLINTSGLFAQNESKMQKINLLSINKDDYVAFYSTDINDFYHPEKSSKYPSINLFDGFFQTCWVAGSYKKNNYNSLYVRLPKEIDLDKIILNIFPGYGKSKILYSQNARPQKIKISIYVAYNPESYNTEVADKYFIKKYSEKIIKLSDTFGVQSFPLNLDKRKLMDFQEKYLINCKSCLENKDIKIKGRSYILQVEIVDTYKGSKYDDVCISEIFFNNRFITPYPLKYNEVKDVYIKSDNALLADYANKKAVVIYKDTSSTFILVDWNKSENFAILHYVPNNAVGPGRIEEFYSLIDLKNRKIVDKEFEKCTGYNPSFGMIEKKGGQVFIENISQYSIELK